LNIFFARGFSEKLNIVATKHRPIGIGLTMGQIYDLAEMAGYRFEMRGHSADRFTVYHADGEHGIDDGLYVNWMVRTDGFYLVYYPTLMFKYQRGHRSAIVDEMLARLACFLPALGFHDEIRVELDEEAVVLHDDLLDSDGGGISVMFITEFQKRFKSLYGFLKEKMLPPR
jgi:hypothetical protein